MATNSIECTTFYVRLQAERGPSGIINGVKPQGTFVNRPSCTGDQVAVKVRMEVPTRLFDSPAIPITVTEDDMLSVYAEGSA